MATRISTVHETGFRVGEVEVRFGLLWGSGDLLMPDWGSRPKEVELDGVGDLTVIQLFGAGPRQATYRLLLETVADARAMAGLVQKIGTLTVPHDSHTVPIDPSATSWVLGEAVDRIANVLLRALVSQGVDPDGLVEAEATFVVASS